MSQLVWVMTEGQTGKVLRGQLRDASGAVDLDAFDSVKFQVARTESSGLLVNHNITPDADQTTETFSGGESVSGKGWFSFTTEATAAALPKRTGGYLVNFKALSGSNQYYFPQSRDARNTFGKLVVQDPLG